MEIGRVLFHMDARMSSVHVSFLLDVHLEHTISNMGPNRQL